MRKFNERQVNEIRHRVNILDESASSVANRMKSSRSAVSDVANYKTYRDIPAAKSIPGFNNYLVYSNGKVWSTYTNRFLKATSKRANSKTKYVRLKNKNENRSVRVEQLVNSLF